MIIKTIIHIFKDMDVLIKKIMNKGFIFSTFFCLISIFVLLIYLVNNVSIFFNIGIILFKTSLMFFADFIIMSIAFDTIKKQV